MIKGMQPTHEPAKINPTQPVELASVFRGEWVGLGYEFFFDSGLGLGYNNHNPLTRPDPTHLYI